MNGNNGKCGTLVGLEGLDGCGKSTQLEMLKASADGNIRFISFPNYNSASGEIIKDYLSGKLCEENGRTGAYTAGSFYAIDRYISYKTDWEKDYKAGKTIIAARYTSSNAIYQMAKLEKSQWDEYLEWLEDYEYDKFAIPRPEKIIFLDMPIEVSQKLLSARYGGDEAKKDIHERNISFLKACREAALYTADKKSWYILPCSDGKNPYTPEKINKELSEMIYGK